MDREAIEERIGTLVSMIEAGSLDQASALADETDRAITSQPDPQLYGWLNFYRFKIAFLREDWEHAWSLVKPRFLMVLTATNGSWFSSVACEVAQKLGRADDVVEQALHCIALRRAADSDEVLIAAQTACELLRCLERDDLNTAFLPIVIDEAREAGENDIAVYGYQALIRNIIATGNGVRIDTLVDGRDWLASIDGELANLALEFIDVSPQVAERMRQHPTAEALWEAGLAGDIGALTRLLDDGAAPDLYWTYCRTALLGAAFTGKCDAARFLLDRGALVDRPTTQGRTPLHNAADQGFAEMCTLLIDHGATVDPRDFNQQTPLHLAGWQDHTAVVRVLLAAGADPGLPDRTGGTAFGLAATEDVPETVTAFLDGGVPVDQRGALGWTALMAAANAGKARIVALLLARGADREIVDDAGRTALSLAREEGHTAVVKLLEPPPKPGLLRRLFGGK